MLEVLLIFLSAAGISMVLWCIAGLLFVPFFDRNSMLVSIVEDDAADIENRVRSYAWFRGSGLFSGKMLLIGNGLTPSAERRISLLCDKYCWLVYRTCSDYTETVCDLHFIHDVIR